MLTTLENLFKLARERKEKPVDGSYTNKLLSDKSLSKSKVLEEINELIEAVENNTHKKKIFFKFGPKNNWRNILDPKRSKKIEEAFKEEMIELGYIN